MEQHDQRGGRNGQTARVRRRLRRAQRLVRSYVRPGTSLADELIAERRKAAEREHAEEDRSSSEGATLS